LTVFIPSRLGVVDTVILPLLSVALILSSSEGIAKPFAESPVDVKAEQLPHRRETEHRLE
jgi:hypothetical protein